MLRIDLQKSYNFFYILKKLLSKYITDSYLNYRIITHRNIWNLLHNFYVINFTIIRNLCTFLNNTCWIWLRVFVKVKPSGNHTIGEDPT